MSEYRAPWYNLCFEAASGPVLYEIYDNDRREVAEVRSDEWEGVTNEEAGSYANLIAAAPELLAALEAAMLRLYDFDDWHNDPTVDKIQAALAKARGETNE